MNIVLSLLASYFLGSIPTAYWTGRIIKKIDIRQYGSGNVGATNTFRVLGKGPGIFVLFVDILKGILAVWLVGDLFDVNFLIARIGQGLAAIIGHNWTLFLRFKGGKGMATSLGVVMGLCIKIPSFSPVLLLAVSVWGVVFLSTGIVSVSSLSAAVALPLFALATNQPMELVFLGVVCCLFVVVRHRSNILRLFSGQEHRVDLWSRKRIPPVR